MIRDPSVMARAAQAFIANLRRVRERHWKAKTLLVNLNVEQMDAFLWWAGRKGKMPLEVRDTLRAALIVCKVSWPTNDDVAGHNAKIERARQWVEVQLMEEESDVEAKNE